VDNEPKLTLAQNVVAARRLPDVSVLVRNHG
jgi:hypothetical protein